MSLKKTLLPLAVMLLAACSPHPTSGEWTAKPGTQPAYSRIKVEYDGKAYLFVPDREDHQVRCFWAGADRATINMDCIINDPSEQRFFFQLRIEGSSLSTLLSNGQILGHYQR